MLTPIQNRFKTFGASRNSSPVIGSAFSSKKSLIQDHLIQNKVLLTPQSSVQALSVKFKSNGNSHEKTDEKRGSTVGLTGCFIPYDAQNTFTAPENPKAKAMVQAFDQLSQLLQKPPGFIKGWWQGYPKKLKAGISELNNQLKALGVLYVVNRNNLYSEGLAQALLDAPMEYFTHAEDKRVDLAERIFYKISLHSKDKKLSSVQQSLFETRYLSHPSEIVRFYALDSYIGLFKTNFPAKVLLERLEKEPNRTLQLKILSHLEQQVSDFPLEESLLALLLEPKLGTLFHLKVLTHQKQKAPETDVLKAGYETAFWEQLKTESDPETKKAWLDVFKNNPNTKLTHHYLEGLQNNDIAIRQLSATLLASLNPTEFQEHQATPETPPVLKPSFREVILDHFKTETDPKTLQTLQKFVGPLLMPCDYASVLNHLQAAPPSSHQAYLVLLKEKVASQKNKLEELKPLVSPLFAYIERPGALEAKNDALDLIQDISGQIDRPQLIDMIDSPEVRLRCIALSGLWNQDAKELLPIFKERLTQETDPELIKQIERALRQWMFADEIDSILTLSDNNNTIVSLAPIQPDNRLYCFAISAVPYQGLQGLDRLLAIARQAQAQSIDINSPFGKLLSKQLCDSVNSVFNHLAVSLNADVKTPLLSQKYPIRPSESVTVLAAKMEKETPKTRGSANQTRTPQYELVREKIAPEKFQTVYNYLFEALYNQYSDVQITAAQQLQKQPFPEFIPALITRYASADTVLKQCLADILNGFKPEELQNHREKIMTLLQSPELSLRKLGITLLVKLHQSKEEQQAGWANLPVLFPLLLAESDASIKQQYKSILIECCSSPSAFNVLNDLLLKRFPPLEQIAIAAELMANQFGQKALEPILKALSGVDESAHLDPRKAKQIESLEATVLKLSKKQEAYPILNSFLKQKNGMASNIVAHALVPIVTSWKRLPPKRQKDLQYDNPELMEPLRQFATHHNASLRDTAQAVLNGFVEEKRKKIESLGIRGSYDKDDNFEMLNALKQNAPEAEIKKAADIAHKKLTARRKEAYGR